MHHCAILCASFRPSILCASLCHTLCASFRPSIGNIAGDFDFEEEIAARLKRRRGARAAARKKARVADQSNSSQSGANDASFGDSRVCAPGADEEAPDGRRPHADDEASDGRHPHSDNRRPHADDSPATSTPAESADIEAKSNEGSAGTQSETGSSTTNASEEDVASAGGKPPPRESTETSHDEKNSHRNQPNDAPSEGNASCPTPKEQPSATGHSSSPAPVPSVEPRLPFHIVGGVIVIEKKESKSTDDLVVSGTRTSACLFRCR